MPFRRPARHDLDALSTQTHRVLHRTLHRAAENDPALELLRYRVRDQLSVDFRLADFLDVDANRNAERLPSSRLEVRCLHPSCRSQHPDVPSKS